MTSDLIDATHDNVGHIPGGTPKVAGYTTGTKDIAWTAADWAMFPRAGHVRLEQGWAWGYAQAIGCDGFDVEAQAVTPAEVVQGVKWRIAAGLTWTTIYASDGLLAAVTRALQGAGPQGWYWGHVDCWLADWNLSEAEASAKLGQLIHGLTCRAVQWASPTSNPGTIVPGTTNVTLQQAQVDLSVSQPGWHAFTPPPPPPAPHLLAVQATAHYSDGSIKSWSV